MADADEDAPVLQPDRNDVDLSEETQDFRFLNSLTINGNDHPTLPRRGEKDFEPNPTLHQRSALDSSRQAMHDALSYPRLHAPKNLVIGHYQPRDASDACVAVHKAHGQYFRTMGSADSQNTIWLLPEEALYLIERGSLDLRWPAVVDQPSAVMEELPMSLQAAYATLMGKSGLTLARYHVFAGLKRSGYVVQRASTWYDDAPWQTDRMVITASLVPVSSGGLFTIFRRVLAALFSSNARGFPSTGPLLAPGIYKNYTDIYRALDLIPFHTSTDSASQKPQTPDPPFRITYNVYKPSTPYKKSAPPPSDFRIAVLDARSSQVPSLEEIGALLDIQPEAPSGQEKRMEVKLRHGYRNVILAIVDMGVVSYLRFSDAIFGQEKLYEQRNKRARKNAQNKRPVRPGGKRG